MQRYGDCNGKRLYDMPFELDSLWLDRRLRERYIPFDRRADPHDLNVIESSVTTGCSSDELDVFLIDRTTESLGVQTIRDITEAYK